MTSRTGAARALVAAALAGALAACLPDGGGEAARFPAPSTPGPAATRPDPADLPPPRVPAAELPPPALPAFPGAEGFGTGTPGGRGGRVLAVTTLADSGAGSLRAALEAEGPRIVVFRTGGTITLRDQIRITNPFVTVAGQSAPGDGITLRASPRQSRGLVVVATHDVVLRHLRFRQGAHREIDAAIPLSITSAHSVVVDHCSLSWGTDEVLTTWDGARDVTLSWNVVAEGLSESTHEEGEHSRGLFVSGRGSGDVSVHHNLIAHHMRRSPEVNTAGTADVRNNVVYDWGTHAAQISDKYGDHGVNVVANYFKPGPSTRDGDRRPVDVYPDGPGMRLYVAGNVVEAHAGDRSEPGLVEFAASEFAASGGTTSGGTAPAPVDRQALGWLVAEPTPAPAVRTTSAGRAYLEVLAGAGARVPTLDAVDLRVLRQVREGTGRIIDDPAEAGGWPRLDRGEPPDDADRDGMPDDWEARVGLRPDVDDSAGDRDGDGYTNVEEYLNSLVGPRG